MTQHRVREVNLDHPRLPVLRLRLDNTPSATAGARPGTRDVLIALCRPLLHSNPFAGPASIRQIAEELVVSHAAVKFHLSDLYDKFGISDTGGLPGAQTERARRLPQEQRPTTSPSVVGT